MRKISCAAVLLTSVLSVRPAAAQVLEVTMGGGSVVDARGAEQVGASIVPAVRWTDGLSSVSVAASATLLDGGDHVLGAGFGGRAELVRVGPVSAELASEGKIVGGGGWWGSAARVSPRVGLGGSGWSLGSGPVWGGAHQRVEREVPSGGLLPGGTRVEEDRDTRLVSGWAADARVVQGVLALGADWTRLRSEGEAWEEIGFGGSIALDRVTLAGSAGVRLGGVRATWAGGSLAVPIGASAALLLEGGRYPSDPLLDRAGGRYLTAGLRLRN